MNQLTTCLESNRLAYRPDRCRRCPQQPRLSNNRTGYNSSLISPVRYKNNIQKNNPQDQHRHPHGRKNLSFHVLRRHLAITNPQY